MVAVAPLPASAAAPAPAAPAPAAVVDQTTDLLKKLSLDSQRKAVDATEPAGAKGATASKPLSVSAPPEQSVTPVLQDFMDPNLFYLPACYYGGYDGSVSEWDDYTRYINPDGVEIALAGHGDIYGYGYAPYGAYSPASSPVPTLEGQMFGAQYQYPTAYFQPPTPVSSTHQGGVQPSVNPEKPALKADPVKTTANGAVPNCTAHSNSGPLPVASSHQNSSLTPDGTYRSPLLGGVPSAGYLDSTYGYDSTRAHIAWYDGSAYTNGMQTTHTSNYMPSSTYYGNVNSARNQNKSSKPQQMGTQNRRPSSTTGSTAPTYPNRMYTSTQPYTQYGNFMKTGLSYGNNGYGSSVYGPWNLGMDNRNKPRGRGNGYYGYGSDSQDGTIELNRGPRSGSFKNQGLYGHTVTIAIKGQGIPSGESKNDSTVPDKTQFNRDDFPIRYDAAKFFVIKSYSEDDIHKSIKYNVWASTANGNKKLDAAYQEAQSKGSACPIFLFFSVNTSGQFVGVAEMTGAVNFEKTLEYWQQDKWNGSFSVKWHIVKDVPNNILKHIILENNENKPVTNSRDTQEVHLEQGLQMLKIFKEHVSKTSILDDFTFYEARQKLMQEKRVKQQQIQKQEVANGKPKVSVPNDTNGELKVPTENGAAPVATYASKVAQAVAEKPALANGVTAKTG